MKKIHDKIRFQKKTFLETGFTAQIHFYLLDKFYKMNLNF